MVEWVLETSSDLFQCKGRKKSIAKIEHSSEPISDRRVISNDRPKKMIVIRQYSEKDREQIIELWKTCDLTRPWNDPNKDFGRKNRVGEDLFIVLEYENKILGTIM